MLWKILSLFLSPGQTHDSVKAQELIGLIDPCSCLLADTAYDNQTTHAHLKKKKRLTVIRPRKNWLHPHPYDKQAYKESHFIERFFNKLKHFRRIFSGFDKSIQSFLRFVYFVGTILWLR